jgi:hypothetical protein
MSLDQTIIMQILKRARDNYVKATGPDERQDACEFYEAARDAAFLLAYKSRAEAAEAIILDAHKALGVTGIVNISTEIKELQNENESLREQLSEALEQIESMWRTIAP